MKAVVAAFNQEKALVEAFSVITNLRMELFEALILSLLVAIAIKCARSHYLTVKNFMVGAKTCYEIIRREGGGKDSVRFINISRSV